MNTIQDNKERCATTRLSELSGMLETLRAIGRENDPLYARVEEQANRALRELVRVSERRIA